MKRRVNPSLRRFSILLPFVLAFASLACRRENPNAREWTAADHDNQEKPSEGQVDPAARATMPSLKEHGIDDVILATWKQNCIVCHGVIGRGDGPQGAMMRPPNFTDPEWQRVHLDDEMARTIQKGRGKMPAFSNLPPETVTGLVRLIRLLNSSRPAPAEPATSASPSAPQAP